MKLVLLYTLLAALATGANIAAQDVAASLCTGPFALPLAMVAGTGVGLVCKYWLDKRFIFRFRPRDAAHGSKTFALYTLMGLATTGIFWGCELGFDYLFEARHMRYLGAVLGLAMGYAVKYALDKRYVFQNGTLIEK